MGEEYDEDNLDEDIEQEMEKAEDEKKVEKAKQGKRPIEKPQQNVVKERYIAVHQPEVIAVVDTVTEEIIADGFKDIGTAKVSAKILNNQEKLIISSGA